MTLNDAAFWQKVSKNLCAKRDELPLGDYPARRVHQAVISLVDAIEESFVEESLPVSNDEKGE